MMNSNEIDLVVCSLCKCYGQKVATHLIDKDLGPVCTEDFFNLLRVEVELLSQDLISPSTE